MANLFYNMSSRQVGLVGLWDVVAFDEVAGISFKDKDGVQRTETITETFPVWEPPQTFRSQCTTRFVMAAARVVDVSFDGEGCLAEELQ